MNFVGRPKTIEEMDKLHQLGIDIFCLDTVFTTKRIALFQVDDIEEAVHKYPNQIYILINRMIHEGDLSTLNSYLNAFKNMAIKGIVINDLTVFVLAKQHGLEHLIIYQPGSFNTDTFSEVYLSQRRIKGITLSREITLEEIKHFGSTGLELSLIGHGYLDMFYSKRKLVTNYLIHKQIQGLDLQNNYDLRLNEEIRENEFYPIFEDAFGTHIFRSKKLISYDEIDELEPIITDLYLERIFLSDQEYYDTILLYNNILTKTEFLKKYKDFDTGFFYKRTEKIKGESNEN